MVGDRVYGRPGPPGVDPLRVWLHAAHLGFDHPVTDERISVDSPCRTIWRRPWRPWDFRTEKQSSVAWPGGQAFSLQSGGYAALSSD